MLKKCKMSVCCSVASIFVLLCSQMAFANGKTSSSSAKKLSSSSSNTSTTKSSGTSKSFSGGGSASYSYSMRLPRV